MELAIGQKELIINWMRTKPYYQPIINRLGAEGALSWYLKGKHPKRVRFILLALETKHFKSDKRNCFAKRTAGFKKLESI